MPGSEEIVWITKKLGKSRLNCTIRKALSFNWCQGTFEESDYQNSPSKLHYYMEKTHEVLVVRGQETCNNITNQHPHPLGETYTVHKLKNFVTEIPRVQFLRHYNNYTMDVIIK